MRELEVVKIFKEREKIKIKEKAEDFVVKEIDVKGEVVDEQYECKGEKGDFLWFLLKKKNWTTDKAIKEIAKRLRISKKRFSWAGTKDRKALTYQLCSCYKCEKEEMERIKIKDIEILCFFSKKEKIKLGELKGNRFEIAIKRESAEERKAIENLLVFPNYFGKQRFGMRENTHIIGYYLVKEMWKEAVEELLFSTHKEKNEEAKKARERLKEERDFRKAIHYFPKHLYLEKIVLSHLSLYPNDYLNAIRKLPRYVLLMFIHSLQAFIFNKELELRLKELGFPVPSLKEKSKEELKEIRELLLKIKAQNNEYYCKVDEKGFPLLEKREEDKEKIEKGKAFIVGNVVGYTTELNSYQEEVLEKLGIEKEEFEMKKVKELSSKGAKRLLLSPIISFYVDKKEETSEIFNFSLPRGSYATSLLNQFFQTL